MSLTLGGSLISADSIALLLKHKTKTRSVKLPEWVPVDLRYETIVGKGGNLHIYHDVYERGTNTLANVKQVLAVYVVDLDRLAEPEKTALSTALEEISEDAKAQAVDAGELALAKDGVPASKLARSKSGKVTARVKGQKETVVAIAALQGKGYSAPFSLNEGKSAADADQL